MATPSTNSVPTQTHGFAGSYPIDALLYGTRWGNGGVGTGVTVTYSFPGDISYWLTVYGNGEPDLYSALNSTQRSGARAALQSWSNVANIRFNEVSDNVATVGEIRFAFTSSGPNEQAHAYSPIDLAEAGDVWLNRNAFWDGFGKGSYGQLTLIHEIGHAIGLKHPFEGSTHNGTLLPDAKDSTRLTVMSYSAWPGPDGSGVNYNPTTPMWYDIASAQYLYGPNNNYHDGNNTYTFAQGQFYNQTIWDAGGVDRIVWSAATQGATIDLRPGFWSDLGNSLSFYRPSGAFWFTSKDTVIIYDDVIIENALGGGAADVIMGNSVANRLIGNAGGDRLTGAGGSDVLYGGVGADKCYGGAGADRFKFVKIADVSTLPGRDLIGDFDASDIIDLSGIDANSGVGGNQAFRYIGGQAFGGNAGELRYAGGLLSGDINGDAKADFRIEVDFKGITQLTALDIIE